MLKNFMNVLNMGADSFYPMLVTLIIAIAGWMCKGAKSWSNRPKPRKVFNLYCKREDDNFYVKIVFWEMAIMIVSVFGAVIIYRAIEIICLSQGYILKWGNIFTAVASVVCELQQQN